MLASRVVIAGDGPIVRAMRRMLFQRDCAVLTLGGHVAPALGLARCSPEILILAPAPSRTRIEGWRRAIAAYRQRRPLRVAAILDGTEDAETIRSLDDVADLGVYSGPLDAVRGLRGAAGGRGSDDERTLRAG